MSDMAEQPVLYRRHRQCNLLSVNAFEAIHSG
jgi:hypothetical protein